MVNVNIDQSTSLKLKKVFIFLLHFTKMRVVSKGQKISRYESRYMYGVDIFRDSTETGK